MQLEGQHMLLFNLNPALHTEQTPLIQVEQLFTQQYPEAKL